MGTNKNEAKYTTRTLRLDGCTVYINRPILSDEERTKAEARIKQALGCYCKG